MMTLSAAGLAFLERQEALRLEPYLDAIGKWTVGYGHLLKPGEPRRPITRAEAEAYLKGDCAATEACINGQHLPVNQHQFDALVSLVYNIGPANFLRSGLLKYLKKGEWARAGSDFLNWNKAGGQVLHGLTVRRTKEREIFDTGHYPT